MMRCLKITCEDEDSDDDDMVDNYRYQPSWKSLLKRIHISKFQAPLSRWLQSDQSFNLKRSVLHSAHSKSLSIVKTHGSWLAHFLWHCWIIVHSCMSVNLKSSPVWLLHHLFWSFINQVWMSLSWPSFLLNKITSAIARARLALLVFYCCHLHPILDLQMTTNTFCWARHSGLPRLNPPLCRAASSTYHTIYCGNTGHKENERWCEVEMNGAC